MSNLRYSLIAVVMLFSLSLTACKLVEKQPPAPIIDAGTSAGQLTEGGQTDGDKPVGEAIYYTVQPGDSLYRIAQRFDQKWETIASWNNISDPSTLSVGTVLLVTPAGSGAAPEGVSIPPSSGIEANAAANVESRMIWDWPAKGSIVGRYDGSGNKGVDIAGKSGDPIFAAADGRVAYVGGDLRGYGNLVIIKHNDVFVTAYAHNQKILVEENQVVRRGEKIAEMGDTDASRVMLHFEIRQQNQEGSSAVDPLKFLPNR